MRRRAAWAWRQSFSWSWACSRSALARCVRLGACPAALGFAVHGKATDRADRDRRRPSASARRARHHQERRSAARCARESRSTIRYAICSRAVTHRFGLRRDRSRSSGLHARTSRRQQLQHCGLAVGDAGACGPRPAATQPGAARVHAARARWRRSRCARRHALDRQARSDQHAAACNSSARSTPRRARTIALSGQLRRRRTAAVLDQRNDRRNARLRDASCVRVAAITLRPLANFFINNPSASQVSGGPRDGHRLAHLWLARRRSQGPLD